MEVQEVVGTVVMDWCAELLMSGTTVLVHGDAGMDATLQVTSLAQVLLDPYCRTAKG